METKKKYSSSLHVEDFYRLKANGTYTNSDGTKSFPISDLYYYNQDGQTYGMVKGVRRSRVIEFIKKNTE